MSTLRAGWIITGRDLGHWVRQPWTPVLNLMFSVMLLLVFGKLFGGSMNVPGGGDYINFLVPGMLALTMMFGVAATATAMADDIKKGVTDRFRSMPIASGGVSLGRAGADMAAAALELVVLLGAGLLVGWRPDTTAGPFALAVLLLLALRFSLIWLGIFIALRFRGEGSTAAVQVLVWPIGFLSSAIASTTTMPAWLGAVAVWNPISATATAVRDLFGNPTGITSGPLADNPVLMAFAWPLVLSLVFIPLSARAYRKLGR
jgi:ABC-2 type transport system permease protein